MDEKLLHHPLQALARQLGPPSAPASEEPIPRPLPQTVVHSLQQGAVLLIQQ
jgi:hypothetical protein